MTNEPFGRQPKPVTIIIQGDYVDVHEWYQTLKNRAGYKGDDTTGYEGEWIADVYQRQFKIYPRAIND